MSQYVYVHLANVENKIEYSKRYSWLQDNKGWKLELEQYKKMEAEVEAVKERQMNFPFNDYT